QKEIKTGVPMQRCTPASCSEQKHMKMENEATEWCMCIYVSRCVGVMLCICVCVIVCVHVCVSVCTYICEQQDLRRRSSARLCVVHVYVHLSGSLCVCVCVCVSGQQRINYSNSQDTETFTPSVALTN